MEGNLKPKMMVLLLAAYWTTAAAGQAVECVADEQCQGGVGYYCDPFSRCRQCLSCEELNRKPSVTPRACITTVTDCGGCLEGLMEEVRGLRCAGASPPVYAWVLLALGALLLLAAAVAVVVYVLRNTQTFRVFTSARTSVQPGCDGAASAPEPPPPYEYSGKQYSPVRPESPNAPPPPPPHFIDEEAASPFIKCPRPGPLRPLRESAGNQEANVYNNPSYVRGPHLPSNYHAAAREPEPEYLVDESTAESPWRPNDAANNNAAGESSDSGSSVAGTSGAGAGAEAGAEAMSAMLATARSTTLVRPACEDAATPNKVPRLRQDTNNNRDRDDESMPRPAPAPSFSIHVNVQQINDVKL